MKKHLIAAAVAAAVSVPAVAQNVTIGGNFDVSYDFGKQNTSTQTLNFAGAFTTSALTIGGSEDLGSGLSAYFNINSRLGAGSNIEGAVGSSQALSDKAGLRAGAINFGDRGFQVGLKGAFGDVAIGKTTGTAIGGTIRGGVAGNFSLLSESLWGDRPNNMLSYTTPSFNGLTGRVIYQLSGGVPQNDNSNGSYEFSLEYKNGPLQVNAAMNTVKAGAYALDTDQGSTDTIAGEDLGIRVQYNFGPVAVNGSYLKNETAAASAPTQYSIGATVPMGAFQLIGEYGNRDSASTKTGKGFYNLGAVYTMSKRTNAYAMLSKNDGATTASTGTIKGSMDGTGADARYVLGLRHSF